MVHVLRFTPYISENYQEDLEFLCKYSTHQLYTCELAKLLTQDHLYLTLCCTLTIECYVYMACCLYTSKACKSSDVK